MTGRARPRWKRVAIGVALGVGALLLVVQVVPYGHRHANPPVVVEPAWDHPATRALAERACFDCHSNQTRWPWYSFVAPTSWLVQSHVDEGREALNFSEWGRGEGETDDLAESVLEGEMPPASYLLAHPGARLSTTERDQLARGLMATASRSDRGGAGRLTTPDEEDD